MYNKSSPALQDMCRERQMPHKAFPLYSGEVWLDGRLGSVRKALPSLRIMLRGNGCAPHIGQYLS